MILINLTPYSDHDMPDNNLHLSAGGMTCDKVQVLSGGCDRQLEPDLSLLCYTIWRIKHNLLDLKYFQSRLVISELDNYEAQKMLHSELHN